MKKYCFIFFLSLASCTCNTATTTTNLRAATVSSLDSRVLKLEQRVDFMKAELEKFNDLRELVIKQGE